MFCDWCCFNNVNGVVDFVKQLGGYWYWSFLFEFLTHEFNLASVFCWVAFFVVDCETNVFIFLFHRLYCGGCACRLIETQNNIICVGDKADVLLGEFVEDWLHCDAKEEHWQGITLRNTTVEFACKSAVSCSEEVVEIVLKFSRHPLSYQLVPKCVVWYRVEGVFNIQLDQFLALCSMEFGFV